MKRLFGGKKDPGPPPPTLTEATETLEARVKRLDAKINQLESELRTYREQLKRVKSVPAQNQIKRKAMQVLKQKKMYEQQRDTLTSQAFNMEQLNFTTQSLNDTILTVSAMKGASTAMKQKFKEINVDSIEDLYDDMADLMEDNDMIQDILSRSFATPEDLDEADLESELEALGDELLMGEDSEIMPSYLSEPQELPASLPALPDNPIPSQPQDVQELLHTF